MSDPFHFFHPDQPCPQPEKHADSCTNRCHCVCARCRFPEAAAILNVELEEATGKQRRFQ